MIDVTQEGDLWIITLNRPEKANALTRDMLEDIADALGRLAFYAKAIVITGEGPVFSAGADLHEIKTTDLATDPLWEIISQGIADMPCLTIAALNGTLAGGACGMALACDLRIATPTTSVFYPVMKLGYYPQPSDPARLAALIGPARAKLVLMAGQRLSAEQCLAYGLVERIVEPALLMDTARAFSADILAAPPLIARGIKSKFQETGL